jgi:hypothetical protein
MHFGHFKNIWESATAEFHNMMAKDVSDQRTSF